MTLNIPETNSKRIVVIGGGFAGLAFVKKAAKSGYQVVLIDRNNYHEFQPLLYQVATAAINPGDIAFPFRKLFRGKKNIFLRMTEMKSIDASNKTIFTSRGSLTYDYLVIASGSSTNYFGMEHIEEESLPMKDVNEALAIRNHVLLNIEKAVELPKSIEREALLNIVIVGGGATGVEIAGAFAEMKNNIIPKDYPEYHHNDINIYLVEGMSKILGTMSEKTSEDSLMLLKKMGVNVILNSVVTDYADKSVKLKDGTSIPTHNLIWTSGVTVILPEGIEESPRAKGGRIVTDDYFRIGGHKDIFAIGDASIQQNDKYPNGYPQLARVAIEHANHLAKNFRLRAKGKEERPFNYTVYPVLATVGRNRAFAEYGKLRIKGFFAWVAWAVIHLALILGVKNKLNVMIGWFWNYLTFDLPTRVIIMPRRKCSSRS